MENPEILQKLIETKPILRVGGAFDSMSAKLVEINNFDAIWAGSFAISATHALPDASILTMTEFLNASSNIVESCKIPVIADCDTGYGGPTNVSHTVRKFESAGVSAISLEDKIFPKQNSLLKGGKQKLISEKEVEAIVIGLPITLKNRISKQTEKVQLIIEELTSEFTVPIHTIDERLSSVSAQNVLKLKGIKTGQNKGEIDKTAAAIFLQEFLDSK